MEHSCRRAAMAALWLLFCLSSSVLTTATPQSVSASLISRHDLFVQIDPERHALLAADRLTIEAIPGRPLRLSLAGTLHLDRLVLSQSSTDDIGRDLPFQIEHEATRSEERRVGKERRYLSGPGQQKYKR